MSGCNEAGCVECAVDVEVEPKEGCQYEACRAYVDAADRADSEFLHRLQLETAVRIAVRNWTCSQANGDEESYEALQDAMQRLADLISDDCSC